MTVLLESELACSKMLKLVWKVPYSLKRPLGRLVKRPRSVLSQSLMLQGSEQQAPP
jgi:hypothetical protein